MFLFHRLLRDLTIIIPSPWPRSSSFVVTGSTSSMTLTSAIILKETRGRDRDCVVLCSVVLLHLSPFGWFIVKFSEACLCMEADLRTVVPPSISLKSSYGSSFRLLLWLYCTCTILVVDILIWFIYIVKRTILCTIGILEARGFHPLTWNDRCSSCLACFKIQCSNHE